MEQSDNGGILSGDCSSYLGYILRHEGQYTRIISATYDSTKSRTTVIFDRSLSQIPGNTTVTLFPGAYGSYSHTEGYNCCANGTYSHAEGLGTKALNSSDHAEGNYTKATGSSSHAEGYYTAASGTYSHAEGYYTAADGGSSHAEGGYTKASNSYSHAEGYQTEASGNYSHAEGSSTKATADYSHAEGSQTVASGQYSHAEGCRLTASGAYSHGEGFGQPDMEKTVSSYAGSTLYMSDYNTTDLPGSQVSYNGYTAFVASVSGTSVYLNTSLGSSMSSGTKVTFKKGAIGTYSHIEGYKTSAIGAGAHAEGLQTGACAAGSHTSGIGTIASTAGQTVVGLPNLTTSDLFVVGGGEYDSDYRATSRKNLFSVGANGKLTAAGNLQLGGGLVTVPKGDFIVSSSTSPSKSTSTKSITSSFTTGSSFTGNSGTVSTYTATSVTISVSVKQIAQTAISPGSIAAGVYIKSSGSVYKTFNVNTFPSGYNKSASSSYTISLTAAELKTIFGTSVTRGTAKTVSYTVE